MSFVRWFSNKLNLSKGAPASTLTGIFIAVAGVAITLSVMELSLAVSVGFKHEIERKLIGFESPISILPPIDYTTGAPMTEMEASDELKQIIRETIPGARPVDSFQRHAILKTDSNFIAVSCKAYGTGHDFSFEKGNLIKGRLTFYDDSIVISETMSRQLGVDTADRTYLYFFVDGKPKMRRTFIAGIYNSNFNEYDQSVIYTTMPLLQNLSEKDNMVTSVVVEGLDGESPESIIQTSERLKSALLGYYRVTNVTETGAIFFNWLNLLDTNVVVIFILMLCIGMFTLISSLFIIILDRIPTIGILRSLGASSSKITGIFVRIAMKVVLYGMVIGNIIALGLIYIQETTHFLPLNPEMYYLDSVPVRISWLAITLLNIGIAVGSWLILLVPARIASRIDPASTMRYE